MSAFVQQRSLISYHFRSCRPTLRLQTSLDEVWENAQFTHEVRALHVRGNHIHVEHPRKLPANSSAAAVVVSCSRRRVWVYTSWAATLHTLLQCFREVKFGGFTHRTQERHPARTDRRLVPKLLYWLSNVSTFFETFINRKLVPRRCTVFAIPFFFWSSCSNHLVIRGV